MPDTVSAPRTKLSMEEICARTEALLPGFRARAAETENERKLPKESIDELYDAGLLQLFAPARYGGLELDWPAIVQTSRIAAHGCASTGWMISVVGGHLAIAARFGKEIQDEIFRSGARQVITTASALTTGTITKVEGGYCLDGVWRFGSGIDYATWVMVTGPCGNHPNPPAPNVFRATVPRDAVRVDDNWHVAGMRGTGSKNIRFEKHFVADEWVVTSNMSFGINPPGAQLAPDAYLFDLPFMPYFTNWMIGPVLGCAEGAYNDYLSATKKRIGAMTGAAAAVQQTVQVRLAESAAELDCAGMLFDKITNTLHTAGLKRHVLTDQENAEINRDRVYMTRLCYNSVQRLVTQMGATAIFDTNPVQRHWRDLSVMASQVGVNWDINMAAYGKYMLGLPFGIPKKKSDLIKNSPANILMN
ncbi:MAG: acyl-CoA dehydrogenase family protein [Rhodospirillaceae bacterium]